MTTADLTEIEPMDPTYWDEYKEATPTATSSFVLPPEGRYMLTLPQRINEENFEIRVDKKTQKPFLQVTLGTTADDPVLIAEGDYAGFGIRYLRFDSKFPPIWGPKGTKEIVGYEKVHAIMDLIMNAGTGDRPVDTDGYKQAVERLAGITLPHPAYLVWEGRAKHASGNDKYLRSKDFPTVTNPDGSKTRASRVTRINPATGESYPVFANLALGRRGWQPRG